MVEVATSAGPTEEDACILASDWLTQVQPIMGDLSDKSSISWSQVMRVAQDAYANWQRAGPLEKSLVVCDLPLELQDARYARLESRALGMLLESLPSRVKDELVVTRGMTCANAIFRVLLAYQPGGLAERQRLIQHLTDPGQAHTAKECSDCLRKWHRWLTRSQDLSVSTPDAAVLLAGLDKLCQVVMDAHAQLSFRCSISRTQHQLDFCPTLQSVTAYARLLQAEMETLSLSGADVDLDHVKKKGRVAQFQKGGKDGSKNGDSTPRGKGFEPPPPNPLRDDGAKGEGKGKCRFFLNKGGCRNGGACTAEHDQAKASQMRRCFNCGAEGHRVEACNRPKGDASKGAKGTGKAPRGESATSSSASGGGGQQANPQGGKKGGGKTNAAQDKQKGAGAQVAAANASSAQETAATTSGPTTTGSNNQTQALVEECAKLLKGFRIAAMSCVANQSSEANSSNSDGEFDGPHIPRVLRVAGQKPRGLLDGGATHALRAAESQQELLNCADAEVNLALGKAKLKMTPVGTLLTPQPVGPICPLGVLVSELGCEVEWTGGTCKVVHPKRGVLAVVMTNQCPELDHDLTVSLIKEIENRRARLMQRALFVKALELAPMAVESQDVDQGYLRWLRDLSPDAPAELLAQVPPEWGSEVKGEDVPLNRRIRRQVRQAKHVVLHLYSGKTKAREFGSLPSSVYVLSIDISSGANMTSGALYRYLCQLCESGKVIGVLGGPPCATLSVLRQIQDGGPRPLRGRSGVARFSLEGLSAAEQSRVDKANILIFRMLLLYKIANEASEGNTFFALEGPQDPMTYHKKVDAQVPSFFAWPEVQYLGETEGMMVACFNQADFGHMITKPTSILTNSWKLYTLLHGRNDVYKPACREGTLSERIQRSPLWGKWAPGLCRALGEALIGWMSTTPQQRAVNEDEEQAVIKALSKGDQAFVEHCEKDHLGYRSDCRVCLESSLRSHLRMRRKHPHSNAFSLGLDLIGPLCKGEDQLGPARHLLIGVLGVPWYQDGRPEVLGSEAQDYDIPADWQEDAADPSAEPGEQGLSLDPAEGEAEDEEDPDSPEARDKRAQECNDRWEEAIKELQKPVRVVPLVFAEPIASKKASVVLRAIQRIYSKIRLQGLSVRRLHTDNGREFNNKQLQAWAYARDIFPTYSVPGDPRSNGRAEGIVGLAKSGMRAFLRTPGSTASWWPHAARQWAEGRYRAGMQLLGASLPKRPLVPFGTPVTVKRREWSRKTPFAPKAHNGVAVAPSANSPGSTIVRMTDPETSDVRFYVAPVVFQQVKEPIQFEGTEDPNEEAPDLMADLQEDAGAAVAAPKSRIRGKTSPVGLFPAVRHVTEQDELGGECCEQVSNKSEGLLAPLSVEDSEAEAEKMLRQETPPSREALDDLIKRSLVDLRAKSRRVDREASGAKGWTLGFYCYENRRPHLVKLVNWYLKGLVKEGTWTALRITADLSAGPHRDRNESGSKNLVAPLSRFQGGRIWIKGEGSGDPGFQSMDGKPIEGRYVGGDQVDFVWFDPAEIHAVENVQGSRRVAVGYTPRLWSKVSQADQKLLHSLYFPIPQTDAQASTCAQIRVEYFAMDEEPASRHPETLHLEKSVHLPDPIGCTRTPMVSEDPRVDLLAALASDDHDDLLSRLSAFVRAEQLLVQEEISQGCGHVTIESLATWQRQLCLHQLCAEHDRTEDGLASGENFRFWMRRAQVVEGMIENVQLESDSQTPMLRLVQADPVLVGQDEDQAHKEGLDEVPLTGCPLEGPLSQHPDFGQEADYIESKGAEPGHGLLQTRTVPQQEVWANLPAWYAPLAEEVTALKVTHQAVRSITDQEIKELEKTMKVTHIPAKCLYTQKPVTNKLRARIVGCENFMSSGGQKAADEARGQLRLQDLYASGLDGSSVRIQVRVAAAKRWRSSVLDIKTAFLTAPLFQPHGDSSKAARRLMSKAIIVSPPRILVHLGLVEEGEKWLVLRALYGLPEAPAAWACDRDLKLSKMTWRNAAGRLCWLERCPAEENLWKIREDLSGPSGSIDVSRNPQSRDPCMHGCRTVGLVGVYVDDILITAEEGQDQSYIDAVQSEWKTSTPEFVRPEASVRFCGYNLWVDEKGVYTLNQEHYVRDLLSKYPDVQGESDVPFLKEDGVEPEEPSVELLRKAQAYAGAFQWLTCRSRPDLAYATNKIAQIMSKCPRHAIRCSENLIRYLRRTSQLGLRFEPVDEVELFGQGGQLGAPRALALLEIFADASFAPDNQKSQTGIVATFGGSCVGWVSTRQSVTSLSTAESELHSTLDGVVLMQTLGPILEDILEAPVRKLVYNDNLSCVSLFTAPSGVWRTRHLRLKAKAFREQLENEQYELRHLVGRWMLGDVCTKPVPAPRLRELCQLMNMATPTCVLGRGESASVASASASKIDPSACVSTVAPAGVDSACVAQSVAQHGGPQGDLSSSDDDWSLVESPNTLGCETGVRVHEPSVAMRLLVVACVLKRVAGATKVTVTVVQDNPEESNQLLKLAFLLALMGVVLVCRWLCCQRDGPRIASVRRATTDSDDEWSLVGDRQSNRDVSIDRDDPGEAVGLRRRVNRTGSRPCRTSSPQQHPSGLVPEPRDRFLVGDVGQVERDSGGGLAPPVVSDGGSAVFYADDVGFVGPAEVWREIADSFDQEHASTQDSLHRNALGGEVASGSGERTAPATHVSGSGERTAPATHVSGSGERTAPATNISGSGERTAPATHFSGPGERTVPAPNIGGHGERTGPVPDGGETETAFQGPYPVVVYPKWQTPKQPPQQVWPALPPWGGPAGNLHQPIPVGATRDVWFWDTQRNVLLRIHSAGRKQLFSPLHAHLPTGLDINQLTGRRRTMIAPLQLDRPKECLEDNFLQDARPTRALAFAWKGRTEFELYPRP